MLLVILIISDIINTKLLTDFILLPIVVVIVNDRDALFLLLVVMILWHILRNLSVMKFDSTDKVCHGSLLLLSILVGEGAALIVCLVHHPRETLQLGALIEAARVIGDTLYVNRRATFSLILLLVLLREEWNLLRRHILQLTLIL